MDIQSRFLNPQALGFFFYAIFHVLAVTMKVLESYGNLLTLYTHQLIKIPQLSRHPPDIKALEIHLDRNL